ncbi:MAG: arginine repressor [Acidobacteria bacterium]|nr:arginine repressor [Acidobacteriota bacterium]
MSKRARQGKILEVTRKRQVHSQEELSSILRQEGIDVTQATLSRDIRELGLVKMRAGYRISEESHPVLPDEMLRRAFKQFVVRTDVSGNIVMIKTSPGNAHSVGVVLDAAQWPEMLGTVAGDDTVFILLRNGRYGKKVLGRIQDLCE